MTTPNPKAASIAFDALRRWAPTASSWLRTAPEGWSPFGTHAGPDSCTYTGTLTFSDECGEDGLPMWERHDGCTAPAKASEQGESRG